MNQYNKFMGYCPECGSPKMEFVLSGEMLYCTCMECKNISLMKREDFEEYLPTHREIMDPSIIGFNGLCPTCGGNTLDYMSSTMNERGTIDKVIYKCAKCEKAFAVDAKEEI
ncbi:MAG: hypothetical protein RSB41_03270 [Bacilli bacterium]